MDNSIKFTYKKKKYELNFTRRTVAEMEENGFTIESIEKVESVPMSTIMKLYDGSFLAFHRDIDEQTRDEIFDEVFSVNAQGLIEILSALYKLTYTTLMSEENEGNSKKWTAPTVEQLMKKL